MRTTSTTLRSGRTLLAVLAYLVAFVVLLTLICRYYLMPALVVKQGADPEQRRLLVASSRLILWLLLLILLLGLLFTFRIGRFFFPRRREPVKPTEYVDAWEEAGRRLKLEDEGEE